MYDDCQSAGACGLLFSNLSLSGGPYFFEASLISRRFAGLTRRPEKTETVCTLLLV
jgi:hypothetical protein